MNDKLELFYRGLKDQKVSFIGLGRSHRELLPMFASKGARVSLRDKRTREQIGEEADAAGTTFGVLEQAGCPAVLAEQCFVTNAEDVAAFAGEEGCRRAAEVYYRAICRYFGTQPMI